MILAKEINFRHPVPLRFGPEKNHKKASYRTNKQDFLHFSLPKALYYYNYLLMGILEKKILSETLKKCHLLFSSEISIFVP